MFCNAGGNFQLIPHCYLIINALFKATKNAMVAEGHCTLPKMPFATRARSGLAIFVSITEENSSRFEAF
jgi:hypothetical protein